MRRAPLLLAVTPSGLVACTRHEEDLQLLAAFAPGDEAAFASWLARRPSDEPCRVLVDLPDEAYEIEELPRVRGRDRHALFARRLAHWFPEPRFARATALGPVPDGRKGFERVLFAGLERSADLLPWLERLENDGRQPALLVPAAALLPRLALPGARRRHRGTAPSRPRLVAASGRAGLRIALLAGEHALFSRLVRGHPDLLADPQALAAEVERTRDYLVAQRKIAADAPLDRIVAELPAGAGPEQAALPPIRIIAADALMGGELPGNYDAHLLLALCRAPTTIGWPLASSPRRWPALRDSRVLGTLGLMALTALGAVAWLDHQAQAADALAANERARAARAAALAAEAAELAAREAERAALAAPRVEPPSLPPTEAALAETAPPIAAAAQPAACPPASSQPPVPMARRIDGILRRPDGEVLVWVEGTWQPAHTLGLRPVAGDAVAVSPTGQHTRLRSGDHVALHLAPLAAGSVQPPPGRGDAEPAPRAASSRAREAEFILGTAEPAPGAAEPSLHAGGARP